MKLLRRVTLSVPAIGAAVQFGVMAYGACGLDARFGVMAFFLGLGILVSCGIMTLIAIIMPSTRLETLTTLVGSLLIIVGGIVGLIAWIAGEGDYSLPLYELLACFGLIFVVGLVGPGPRESETQPDKPA
jgi:hypothetical protein